MFFQKYKKIIIVIVVMLVAFIIYSFVSGGNTQEEELLTSTNANQNQTTQSRIVGSEIISALNQIQTLNLSRDIFDDPVFGSLIDRSEPIPEEPVGKNNPFAPIGSEIRARSTRGTSTPSTNTIINTTNNRPATNEPVI